MRLGIMQPYFAPALGYFDLIHITDEWIVFDTAQYRKKSWMSRNRILHPSDGWQYITAHVRKHSREAAIREIRLAPDADWRETMVGQLRHYARRAPHYQRTVDLLAAALAAESESLPRLSVDILARVCRLLELDFRPRWFSELELTLGPIAGPGDWALRISEALGATEYVNPPGGEDLFDAAAFASAGIDLVIRRFADIEYAPRGYSFIPTLSVLDVLMWCGADQIRSYLDAQRSAFAGGQRGLRGRDA